MTRAASGIVRLLVDHKVNLDRYGEPYRIRRTYAGHGQKGAGAWSWLLVDSKECEVAGSQWTVREILTAHRGAGVSVEWQGGGMDICPV